MSKREKLLKRLYERPSDFTWDELVSLLAHNGWRKIEGSGSRVKFDNGNAKDRLSFHKPHPGNIVKRYVLDYVIQKLDEIKLVSKGADQ